MPGIKHHLLVGQQLGVGEALVSAANRYFLTLQRDGDLTVHKGSGLQNDEGEVWRAGVHSTKGRYFAVVEAAGKLADYRRTPARSGPTGGSVPGHDPLPGQGKPHGHVPQGVESRVEVWSTGTSAPGGAFFASVGDDGILGLYSGNDVLDRSRPVWTSSKSALSAGESLQAGQYLVSPSASHFLIMQGDGNLVLYRGSGPADNQGVVWASGVCGRTLPCYAVMQTDGNLVTYESARGGATATWSTQTFGDGGAFFASLGDDGILSVCAGRDVSDRSHRLWASRASCLQSPSRLVTGQSLVSANGKYELSLGGDGNLVVYRAERRGAAWCSYSNRATPAEFFLVMQGDGNLVIYAPDGAPIWDSHVARGEADYFLRLGDDGNLMVLQGFSDDFRQEMGWLLSHIVWSAGVRMTDFIPSVHGWPFGNPWGYCGGWCWTALDKYNAGIAIPRDIPLPGTGAPIANSDPNGVFVGGNLLFDEIWNRQCDAVGCSHLGVPLPAGVGNGVWYRVFEWQNLRPDQGSWIDPYHSIGWATREEWNNVVKPSLDAGKPITLVLIKTIGGTDFDLNHQVIAVGYHPVPKLDGAFRILLCDPNEPNNDDVSIQVSFADVEHIGAQHIVGKVENGAYSTTKTPFRGFFGNPM